MDCLAVFNSGNYAMHVSRLLQMKGYVFDVVSTPCKIATGGCGYSIKFPCEYKDLIISEAKKNNIPIGEIYKVIPMFMKNKYEKQ